MRLLRHVLALLQKVRQEASRAEERKPEKEQGEESEVIKKKRKKRCEKYNKKLKFVFGECRCGGKFCHLHLHDHECTFDYRMQDQEKLKKRFLRIGKEFRLDKI